ncbi:helix-turn-helix domain-containing protein [Kitasatospora sp. NPDC001603]|uniref:helix-turn-helix domain-containing protein n=1 Tax=Kitasatospora sp. NPDC001603 TaxID=3154388 RepID=UPI003324BA3A
MTGPITHPLAYARAQRGWSQADLVSRLRLAAARHPHGLRTGVDKSAVSRWENGHKIPLADTQLLIADAFGVPHSDVELFGWPHWLPGREDPVPVGTGRTVTALRDAQKVAMDPHRRTFVAFGAFALAGLATQWATLEPERLDTALDGKRVDAQLLDWLEDTSRTLNALPTEQRQHTSRLMDAQLATITDLIDGGNYSAATGRRLHRLAGTLAVTCGWYRFDQGEHHLAGRLWNAALVSAHAGDDRDLGAGVLSDFAYQAIWLNNPDSAVAPLTQALSRAGHPTARSLLHLRRARAHAALGDRNACHRDLSAAEAALLTDTPDPAPAWCAWMGPADLAVDSGQCLLDLGRASEALGRIDEGIGLLPEARAKTKAVFQLSQARGLLGTRDIEQALHITTAAVETATRIGAQRCVAQAKELAPAFKPYARVHGVPALLSRLAAA